MQLAWAHAAPLRCWRKSAGSCTQKVRKRRPQTDTQTPRCCRPAGNAWSPDQPRNKPAVDVVLSSGFLAFGSHCGFLQAIVDARLEVAGVMGTSSGALVGSLFAAGLTPLEILDEFGRIAPLQSTFSVNHGTALLQSMRQHALGLEVHAQG